MKYWLVTRDPFNGLKESPLVVLHRLYRAHISGPFFIAHMQQKSGTNFLRNMIRLCPPENCLDWKYNAGMLLLVLTKWMS